MIKVIKNNYLMLRNIYKYCPSYIFVSIFQSILTNAISIISVLFTKYIVDSMTENRTYIHIVLIAFGIYFIQMTIASISIFMSQYLVPRNAELLSQGMLGEIFEQALKIDYECYENTQFYTDFTMAVNQADNRAVEVLQTFSNFVGSILGISSFSVLISVLDPIMFIAVFINVCVNLFFSFFISKEQHRYYEEQLDFGRDKGYARRVFYLKEYAKELRLFGKASEVVINSYKNAVSQLLLLIKEYARITSKLYMGQNVSTNCTSLIVALYLVYRVLNNKMKLSNYFALTTSTSQLATQITHLIQIIPDLYTHSLYIENYLHFINYKPHIVEKQDSIIVKEEQEIRFQNVSFSYPNTNREILKNISFTIRGGEKIAFVGPNGSGKSTIIKLITRLYDVDEGNIFLNNIDIADYNLRSLREHIGIVFQDYKLFAFTIAENILMRPIKDKEKDLKKAWAALDRVGLSEKVKNLPEGIFTKYTNEFDEKGVFFSGGEKQAIAMARIYASDYNIIILDESNSSLDPLAENKFFSEALEYLREKTLIIISHRLNSVVNANCIYYLENGEVMESGTHEALMKKRGKYYCMYASQEKYQKMHVKE